MAAMASLDADVIMRCSDMLELEQGQGGEAFIREIIGSIWKVKSNRDISEV